MSLLSWDIAYNIGVRDTDEQHQRLFYLLNEFIDLEDIAGNDDLSIIFSVIVDYLFKHIDDEGLCLQENGYNEYLHYKQPQINLISAANTIKARFESGATNARLSAKMFLKYFIKSHVCGTHRSIVSARKASAA